MSFVASKNSQCHFCGKTVYAMEKMDADGKSFHKACFKCEHCQCVLKLGNFAAMGGRYFCKPHFKQLFKEKGNYHSGFGSEDAKSKWAPQAVVFGAPGANFMKASASEWDSRQTKSFRMPRPRAETDITKSSTLILSADKTASEAPAGQTSSAPPSPAPSASVPAKGGDFKPPRESLAQLASVGALKSVGERWGAGGGPAGDASRDQRRRAALEARKAEKETESTTAPAPTQQEKAEEKTEKTAEEKTEEEKTEKAEESQVVEASVAEPEQVAEKEVSDETTHESTSLDQLKSELDQARSEFASEKAAFEEAKQKFEDEKKAFEEQRKAFDEQKEAFEKERQQWAEARATEVPAVVAEVQA